MANGNRWLGARVLALAAILFLTACREGLTGPPVEGGGDPPDGEQGGGSEPPFAVNDPAIAFVSDRDGVPHVYVADADGTHVVRLAEGGSPAWSWDGRRIAFVRGTGRNSRIWVMNTDGSGQRSVTDGFAPAWSPDGRIAFHSYTGGNPYQGGIMVVNADGSGLQLLLPHTWALQFASPGGVYAAVQFPSWSPDGKSIGFWFWGGYYGGKGVGIMKADGSEARDLQADRSYYRSTWGRIQWSPDGSFLTTTSENSAAIVSVEKVGLAIEHYLNLARLQYEPDWSPDGRQILFSQGGYGPDERRRIFVLELLTNDVRQLIPEAIDPVAPGYSDTEPAWSRAARTDAGL